MNGKRKLIRALIAIMLAMILFMYLEPLAIRNAFFDLYDAWKGHVVYFDNHKLTLPEPGFTWSASNEKEQTLSIIDRHGQGSTITFVRTSNPVRLAYLAATTSCGHMNCVGVNTSHILTGKQQIVCYSYSVAAGGNHNNGVLHLYCGLKDMPVLIDYYGPTSGIDRATALITKLVRQMER